MNFLVDTHCHLDYSDFEGQREAVIDRACENGLRMILNPGTDLQSTRAALALTERFDILYAGAGIHPNDGKEWNPQQIDELSNLCAEEKVLAIGEIGLDYYWDKTSPESQRALLQVQLALSAEKELPVIIHNREADEDITNILCAWQASLAQASSSLAERPGVFHSFSGSQEMADKVLAHNFYIGITGPVTFKKAEGLREIVRSIPKDKILIETDSPFLSPEPRRGKKNEPGNVRYVADKIAELKRMDSQEFVNQSSINAQRLFNVELAS